MNMEMKIVDFMLSWSLGGTCLSPTPEMVPSRRCLGGSKCGLSPRKACLSSPHVYSTPAPRLMASAWRRLPCLARQAVGARRWLAADAYQPISLSSSMIRKVRLASL